MPSKTSIDLRKLLREYVRGDEKAFQVMSKELSGLIYHTAMRRSGNHSCAEEVVQIVLVQISRKAGKLSKHPELLAWVHEASRLETLKFQRGELRRKKREEKVMMIPGDDQITDPHLLAELDESMKVLKDSERELVLMKYFQGRTFSAIAAETGRSESAEKMRLKRALEKMAGWFGKNGVTLTVAGLTTVLSTEMGKAAPVGLVGVALGGITATAGFGKVVSWVATFVMVGSGVALVSKSGENAQLVEKRDQLMMKGVQRTNQRREVTSLKSRRHWTRELSLDLLDQEIDLPIEELVWRLTKADSMFDYLASEMLAKRVALMDVEKRLEICRLLGVALPEELIDALSHEVTHAELMDLLMDAGVRDGNLRRFLFRNVTPLEGLSWLVKKEKMGEIVNRGHVGLYREEFWREVVQEFRHLREDQISDELISLVEEGSAHAPLKNKASLDELVTKLRKKKGGEE